MLRNLLILLVAALSVNVFPQVNISGTVKEAITGEVLIGVNLGLFRDSLRNTNAVKGASTNKFGFYSIPGVPNGNFYLFVSSMGFKTIIKEVSIKGKDANIRFDFNLEKTTYDINEIVIKDKKYLDFSTTSGTVNLNPEMIKKLPSLGGETDIFRTLQLLPGVTTASEISTGIYVRGSSADQTLTLIDGVPVYNPSHLGGFASTFNSDAIRDIKLIKGSFPAEYGGRLASVLDITTREGSREQFKGSVGLNLFSTRMTIEGPFDSSSTIMLSGRYMFLDKLLPAVPKFNNIPRYNFYDMNGKVTYRLANENTFSISTFLSSDQINEPPINKDVGFDINWKNTTVGLTWGQIISPTVFSNTSLMYTNYKFKTLVKDKVPSLNQLDFFTTSDIKDFYLKREMQFYLNDKNSLKAGAELVYHNFSTTTSDYFTKELDYQPVFGKTLNTFEASLYAQDDIEFSPELTVNAGTRLTYVHGSDLFVLEPRLSTTYHLLERLILRGAVSISNQTLHLLSRDDIYFPTDVWYPSTSKIRPSRSYQASFGFEAASFDKTFLFTAEGYYKQMDDLYKYKDNASFNINDDFEAQITPGNGKAYGVELFFNKRIGDFSGWMGYTLSWIHLFYTEVNVGKEFYPRYDKRHDLSLVLSYEPDKNFSIGATWTYSTGQAFFLPISQFQMRSVASPSYSPMTFYYDYSAKDAFRLPAFHKLDISARYTIEMSQSQTLELSFNIYNAYNRYNVFSKYIGYKLDADGNKIPVLKQFTLFPFLPTFGINYRF